jgi:hypothetical protein
LATCLFYSQEKAKPFAGNMKTCEGPQMPYPFTVAVFIFPRGSISTYQAVLLLPICLARKVVLACLHCQQLDG